MRKKLFVILTIILLTHTFPLVDANTDMYIPDISMKISSNCIVTPDKVITLDEAAVIKDGRSFFPLRGIAEYYGITVDYLPETQTIVLKDSYLEARLQPGYNRMIVSYGNYPIPGRVIELDAPPFISENGRTMLPIRAVAEEVFGCDVEWDANEQKVTLCKKYQTKRIIAKANSADYQYNIPNVTVSDGYFENVSFLDFPNDTPDGVIRYYCHLLNASDDIAYAEPDVVLQGNLL